jgi:AraC family L-rhamnose operon regulatory protein RhaS
MARACGLGTTRFAHYCRQITNQPPLQHLSRLRVERGAALLRSAPDRRILDIALDCGFASSQYFATVFRRLYGCAPRTYRRAGGRNRPKAAAPAPLTDLHPERGSRCHREPTP